MRFLGEYFSDAPCAFHAELMRDLESPPRRMLARVAPRGHGKSVCAALAFPLWCICHGRRRNIVIVTHESSLAVQFVRDIRSELECNDRIRQTYGDLCEGRGRTPPALDGPEVRARRRGRPGPVSGQSASDRCGASQRSQGRGKWSQDKFTTVTGITVQAKGVGAGFRGMRVGPQRPDLVICDDIEKDELVETPEGRRRLEQWLRRVVMPALAPDGLLVVLGSILHYDSLLANLRDRDRFPGWDYRVYRALEAEPQPAELPPGAPIPGRLARGAPSGPAADGDVAARTVARPREPAAAPGEAASASDTPGDCTSPAAHTPALQATSSHQPSVAAADPTGAGAPGFRLRALWPARWPVQRLLEERERIGTLAFEQEYMANPIDDSLRVFRPEWLRRYDPGELVEERLTTVMAVDPATGASSGDFFALWVGSIDRATGVIYTRELTMERIGVVDQVRRIVAAFERWKPVRIGVETVAYQAALRDILDDYSRRSGLYMPVVGLHTTANKRARIEGSAAFYENGTFRLPKVLDPQVESQFLHFPKARHDDAPDVCAMGIELARSLRTAGAIEGLTGGRSPFARRGGW